jgi:hypothetical protein
MAETWFGLENGKKISQIINDYQYLLFSPLFILCCQLSVSSAATEVLEEPYLS